MVTNQGSPELLIGDPEVKILKTEALERDSFLKRLSSFADWDTALKFVARIQRLANRDLSGPISVEKRKMAALALIKAAQRKPLKKS